MVIGTEQTLRYLKQALEGRGQNSDSKGRPPLYSKVFPSQPMTSLTEQKRAEGSDSLRISPYKNKQNQKSTFPRLTDGKMDGKTDRWTDGRMGR